ncbi:MAG: S8 family serine peptidase, partial [Flavobacteriales bacterium]|nr:S8 family serine peptidase [Flavobacteriales bacterium]
AVHVRGMEIAINALSMLSFVASIDFANKSLNTLKRDFVKKQSKIEEVSVSFNYGDAFNQIEMIKGEQLHLSDYTGNGVTIAVLDGGFTNVNTMLSFKRLRDAGHLLGEHDFVDNDEDVYSNTTTDHGTWVLSTMAGYLENQYVGTAPDASYYLFITEDGNSENPVEESYWVEAAELADSLGVDIINTSLGYTTFDNPNYNYSTSDMNGNTAFISKGANIAFEKGILLVNSAGNSGNDSWQIVGAPADAPGVLSVGAVTSTGSYASFSSIGGFFQPTQKPDVVAQGQASYIIDRNDAIATSNGTSFSSPILAGGIACLWQALPNKTNAEIMQLVRESASQYNTPDNFLGFGIPNLQLALNNALSMDTSDKFTTELKIFPNPTNDKLYFNLPSNETDCSVQIYDILGKRALYSRLNVGINELDMSFISKGVYIANVQLRNRSKSYKIIKN